MSRLSGSDMHLADQAPFAAGGHGHQLAISIGFFNILQPGGICRVGSVDHQHAYQPVRPVGRDSQAVAGKSV